MKKQDIAIVCLLFLALLGWMFYQNKVGRERLAELEKQRLEQDAFTAQASTSDAGQAGSDTSSETVNDPLPAAITATPAAAADAEPPPAVARNPEQVASLRSDGLVVAVSSRGGAVVEATLLHHPATLQPDSGPVVFDFPTDRPCAGRDFPASRRTPITPFRPTMTRSR